MASKLTYENATKTLQFIRNFLVGKELQMPLRHALSQSPRNIPAPALPVGAAHKLADNYYYTRDGRRAVCPPVKANRSLLESGSSEKESTTLSAATPADVYIARL